MNVTKNNKLLPLWKNSENTQKQQIITTFGKKEKTKNMNFQKLKIKKNSIIQQEFLQSKNKRKQQH